MSHDQSEETLDALVARRTAAFKRRAAAQPPEDGEVVTLGVRGPIAIYFGGDPHLDNDGCDLPAMQADLATVAETEGMYAVSLGDMTDNWVGRLAELYADNEGTVEEGWRLLEWYGKALGDKWLLWVLGNHDTWGRRGTIVELLGRLTGVRRIRHSDARLKISGPDWKAPVRLHVRHSFPGRSEWNVNHGPQKAAVRGAWKADVLACGHTHQHGYALIERPDTSLVHVLQVGSYKRFDPYGRDLGLAEARYGRAAVVIINPDADSEDAKVLYVQNVQHAARLLRLLRAAR